MTDEVQKDRLSELREQVRAFRTLLGEEDRGVLDQLLKDVGAQLKAFADTSPFTPLETLLLVLAIDQRKKIQDLEHRLAEAGGEKHGAPF